MARIILKFNQQVIKEYPLYKDRVTIGRNENNTITIDNLAVSGFHARIDPKGDDYILTDLQSTNGTFVNDKKILSHKLVHGDSVTIGKHVIIFVGMGMEADISASTPKMDMDRTMILDTAKQKELLAKQKDAAPAAEAAPRVGVLRSARGSAPGEIELTNKLTRIGKSDTSDIRLAGLFMPATAATISRRPTGYIITPIAGKLKVNGEIVRENIVLKEFDTIKLGRYRFQFYEKEPRRT
jgi:predicted component of type VI protein secretion system